MPGTRVKQRGNWMMLERSIAARSSRTHATTRGFMKALIDSASDRILGFSAFGAEAGEVMASVQVAMIAELPFTALRDAIFTHPTMAEGLIPLLSNVTPTSAPVGKETRVLSATVAGKAAVGVSSRVVP